RAVDQRLRVLQRQQVRACRRSKRDAARRILTHGLCPFWFVPFHARKVQSARKLQPTIAMKWLMRRCRGCLFAVFRKFAPSKREWPKRKRRTPGGPPSKVRRCKRLEQAEDRLFGLLRDRQRDRAQLLAGLQRQQVGR